MPQRMDRSNARDPHKPPSYYLRVAGQWGREVEKRIKGRYLLGAAATDAVNAGCALYSAGQPRSKTSAWFKKAVQAFILDLEVRDFKLVGPTHAFTQIAEIAGASVFVGRHEALAQAFARCIYSKPSPVTNSLLDQLESMLLGQKVRIPRSQASLLHRMAAPLMPLPRLFRSVVKHQETAFVASMTEYVSNTGARRESQMCGRKDVWYPGRWMLLAGACYVLYGDTPALPASICRFLPLDLMP